MKIPDKIEENRIEYNTQIYTIAVMAMLLRLLFTYSAIIYPVIPNIVLNGFYAVFVLLLIYKIVFMQQYSRNHLVFIAVFMLSVIISFSYTKFATLVYTALFIVAMQNVDLKKVISCTYKFKAVFLLFHTICYFVIYITDPSRIEFDYRLGDTSGMARHNFMLGHANVAAMLVVWTILEYIFVNYDRITKKNILFLWLINLFFKMYTDSNSSIILVTLVSVMVVISKDYKEATQRFIDLMSKYLFLFFFIFSALACMMYTSLSGALLELWNVINEFFSGRLLYGACAYDLSGISIVGKKLSYYFEKIYWRGYWIDGMVFDNVYVLFFVLYGCATLAVFVYMIIKANKYMTIEEKIVIIAFSAYSMMETYVLNSAFCFAIVILGKAIFGHTGEINTDEERKSVI